MQVCVPACVCVCCVCLYVCMYACVYKCLCVHTRSHWSDYTTCTDPGMTKASAELCRVQTSLSDSARASQVHQSSLTVFRTLMGIDYPSGVVKAQSREQCIWKRSVWLLHFSNGVGLTQLHRKPAKDLRKLYQQKSHHLNLKATEAESSELPIPPHRPCLPLCCLSKSEEGTCSLSLPLPPSPFPSPSLSLYLSPLFLLPSHDKSHVCQISSSLCS